MRILFILLILLSTVLFSLIFAFYYSSLVAFDLSSLRTELQTETENMTVNIVPLTGLKIEKYMGNDQVLVGDSDGSNFAIYLPLKADYQLKVDYFPLEPNKLTMNKFTVIVNDKILNLAKRNTIKDFYTTEITLPKSSILEGFNRLSFFWRDKKTGILYKNIILKRHIISDYEFPRGYLFFTSTRWFLAKNKLETFFLALLNVAILSLLNQITYLILLKNSSKLSLTKILKLYYYSYLPSIIFYTILYFSFRIFLIKISIFSIDFLIFTLGSIILFQVVYIYKLANLKKAKNLFYLYVDKFLIYNFIIFLSLSALLVNTNHIKTSEIMANFCFVFLFSAFIVKFIDFVSAR